MRRLASLCRRLYRVTGTRYHVVCKFRGCYFVYRFDSGLGATLVPSSSSVFSSVRECEQFLITLFR